MNSVMLAYINSGMLLIDGCNRLLVFGFTELGSFQVTHTCVDFLNLLVKAEFLHQVLIFKETLQLQLITYYVLITLKLLLIICRCNSP